MAQQKTALEKVDIKKLSDLLTERKVEIQKAAGKALDPEILMRVALSAVQKNPLLMQCSIPSIITSIMDAASYGLVPNSLTNEGHLVPFWSSKNSRYECTFIAGYKGLIKLVTNTGLIDGVDVRAFYERDFIEFAYGINPMLNHVPSTGDRGKFVGAYAVVFMKEGRAKFELVSAVEADAHFKRYSKSKTKDGKYFGPWVENFNEMVMKTALRKCLKYCAVSQTSAKLAEAIQRDENFDNGFDLEAQLPDIKPPRAIAGENGDIPLEPPIDISPPVPITEEQINGLRRAQKAHEWAKGEAEAWLLKDYGFDSFEEITSDKYEEIFNRMNCGELFPK